MDFKNPLIVSIASGLLMYALNTSKTDDTKNKTDKQLKDVKQTRLNYAFLTSIVVFLIMHCYTSSDGSSIEHYLSDPFDT